MSKAKPTVVKLAKSSQAPTPAPVVREAPVASRSPAPAPPRHPVPVGVYLDSGRHGAIVIKHTANGLWYLTILTGQVTLEHSSVEKFQRDFHLNLPLYPLRRAIRLYSESLLTRDEQCDKVMRVLLRDL